MSRGTTRRALLGGAASLVAAPAVLAQAPSGVALVIGNGRYKWEAPLPNVHRDAPDVARRLEALGLKTELLQDAGRDDMRRAIDAFSAASKGARFAAFYFAGHGTSWWKNTYLVPVDVDLGTLDSLPKLIPVNATRAAVYAAQHRLLVFDNCRNNPADGWRQREAEQYANYVPAQAEVQAPDTLVMFSTAPGRAALDGPSGQNSPFAATFLNRLSGASVELQTLSANVRRDLLIATEGRQVLWDRNTFQGAFQLTGKKGAVIPVAKSGWSADPSRIIDLSNAYAFAQQSGLPLPAGLIAHRPAAGSRDGMKVGAWRFTAQGPAIAIVVSVEEQKTAEMIVAARAEGPPTWFFIRGTLSGDSLEFELRHNERYAAPKFTFKWSDANSGSTTAWAPAGRSGAAASNSKFARLDG